MWWSLIEIVCLTAELFFFFPHDTIVNCVFIIRLFFFFLYFTKVCLHRRYLLSFLGCVSHLILPDHPERSIRLHLGEHWFLGEQEGRGLRKSRELLHLSHRKNHRTLFFHLILLDLSAVIYSVDCFFSLLKLNFSQIMFA